MDRSHFHAWLFKVKINDSEPVEMIGEANNQQYAWNHAKRKIYTTFKNVDSLQYISSRKIR